MPTPQSTVTFRPELAQLAYLYAIAASLRGFIGLNIMPIFEVPLQSATVTPSAAKTAGRSPSTTASASCTSASLMPKSWPPSAP